MTAPLDTTGRSRLDPFGRAYAHPLVPPCEPCQFGCGALRTITHGVYARFAPGRLATGLVLPEGNSPPGRRNPRHDAYYDDAVFAAYSNLSGLRVAEYFNVSVGGRYVVMPGGAGLACGGEAGQAWDGEYLTAVDQDGDAAAVGLTGLCLRADGSHVKQCFFSSFSDRCRFYDPRSPLSTGIGLPIRYGVNSAFARWAFYFDLDNSTVFASAWIAMQMGSVSYVIPPGPQQRQEVIDSAKPPTAEALVPVGPNTSRWHYWYVQLFAGSASIPAGWIANNEITAPLTIQNALTDADLGGFGPLFLQNPSFDILLRAHAGGSLTLLDSSADPCADPPVLSDEFFAEADFSTAPAQQPTNLRQLEFECVPSCPGDDDDDGGEDPDSQDDPPDCNLLCVGTGLPPEDCDPENCPPVPGCPIYCRDGSVPVPCLPSSCPEYSVANYRWYQLLDCCTSVRLQAAVFLNINSTVDSGRTSVGGENLCVAVIRDGGWVTKPSSWEEVGLAHPGSNGCGPDGLNVEQASGTPCCVKYTLTPCDAGGTIVTDTDLSDAIGTGPGGANRIVEIGSTGVCYEVEEGGSGVGVDIGSYSMFDTCELCEACECDDLPDTITMTVADDNVLNGTYTLFKRTTFADRTTPVPDDRCAYDNYNEADNGTPAQVDKQVFASYILESGLWIAGGQDAALSQNWDRGSGAASFGTADCGDGVSTTSGPNSVTITT